MKLLALLIARLQVKVQLGSDINGCPFKYETLIFTFDGNNEKKLKFITKCYSIGSKTDGVSAKISKYDQ